MSASRLDSYFLSGALIGATISGSVNGGSSGLHSIFSNLSGAAANVSMTLPLTSQFSNLNIECTTFTLDVSAICSAPTTDLAVTVTSAALFTNNTDVITVAAGTELANTTNATASSSGALVCRHRTCIIRVLG